MNNNNYNNRNNNNRRPNPNGQRQNQNPRPTRDKYFKPDGYIKIKKPQSRQRQLKSRRRKRTSALATFAFRFLLFLSFFIIIGTVCLGVFFLGLTHIKKPSDILYTVKTVEIKKEKPTEVFTPVSVPYDTGFANEQYYFPVNNIMEKMEFVEIGDKSERTFDRRKSDEYIKFILGSNVVYINGEKYHLSVPAFSDGDNQVYVPVDFLNNIFENLTFTFDEENKNNIKVDIGEITGACFKIKKAHKLEAIEESPLFGENPVSFTSDLSAYEKYFNPPADSADEYIRLINQTHPLEPQDYVPPDLVDVKDTRPDRAARQLRLYPEMALEAFLIEARANGFMNVTVTSAYRSYAEQTVLFNNEVANAGSEEIAATAVARPGQSEHQSGMCLDMHSYSAAAQNFGNEPDGKWLAENAHYFGFILRYPKDKTEITGIMYEPWHFRYVGRYHATRIYEMGLCLEEYWEQGFVK